jgi:ribosomal protein L32
MAGFLDRLRKGADKSAFEADKLWRVAGVRCQINALKGQAHQRTQTLGTQALELFDAGQLTQPELLETCGQIAALRQRIAEEEAKIEAIQQGTFLEAPARRVCSNCGGTLVEGVTVCPECGTQVGIPELAPAKEGGAQTEQVDPLTAMSP